MQPSAPTGFKLKPMKPETSGPDNPGSESKPKVRTDKKLRPMKHGLGLGQPDVERGGEPVQSLNQRVEGFGIEILKSIVYGGLVECVTSLGVVSSAAGSGATTVNILAIGFANLFSGLTVIIINLKDLTRENQERRYKELLGRRQHCAIHVFLSILSFLVFGLIPPLVYAFAFRKIGDKNYKLLSAFAASLFCILLLAVIRVAVRTQPRNYLKTVVYYFTIVVSSSGISFVVGELIGEVLKQLGWFEPNRTGKWSVLHGKPVEYSRLVSY